VKAGDYLIGWMDRKAFESGRLLLFPGSAGKLVTLRINSKSTPRGVGSS